MVRYAYKDSEIKLGDTQLRVILYIYENIEKSNEGKIRLFNNTGSFNLPVSESYGYRSVMKLINSLQQKNLIELKKEASSYTKNGKVRYATFIYPTQKGKQLYESLKKAEESKNEQQQ